MKYKTRCPVVAIGKDLDNKRAYTGDELRGLHLLSPLFGQRNDVFERDEKALSEVFGCDIKMHTIAVFDYDLHGLFLETTYDSKEDLGKNALYILKGFNKFFWDTRINDIFKNTPLWLSGDAVCLLLETKDANDLEVV